jgi:excisionase family DNA binding protein
MSQEEQPWMTVAEMAKHLRINIKTLYSQIAQGEFPAVRMGRKILIPRQEAAQWMHERAMAAVGR